MDVDEYVEALLDAAHHAEWRAEENYPREDDPGAVEERKRGKLLRDLAERMKQSRVEVRHADAWPRATLILDWTPREKEDDYV